MNFDNLMHYDLIISFDFGLLTLTIFTNIA